MAYNWRSTLGDYAQTAGVLAGFCFALIVLVFSQNVGSASLYGMVTIGQLSVMILGLASVLYIAAMGFFLSAKAYDFWSLPDKYYSFLEKNLHNWTANQATWNETCRAYEKAGRWAYNISMTLLFLGLALITSSYNFTLAVLIFALGICLEFAQLVVPVIQRLSR